VELNGIICKVVLNNYSFTTVRYPLQGTVSRDFLLLVFFMNQFPPSPRVFHLERFVFFQKFAEIFASQGAPPVSTTPVANLPPVSTTPAAILPPVSTPRWQICHRYQQHRWQIFPPFSLALLIPVANLPPVSFATGVNDTGGNR
jgi:hypothetical protein